MSIILDGVGEKYHARIQRGIRELIYPKTLTLKMSDWNSDVAELVPHEPAPWTGEGLPPVGTVCEYQTWVNREWKRTKVLAHHLGFAVHSWSVDGDDMEVDSAPPQDFRPLRTPEQIAEEEREAAITDIALIMGKDPDRPFIREKAGILYDAGYRKQPWP